MTRRPRTLALLLGLALAAGAATSVAPVRAGTEDAIVRQLERLTDAIKEIGRREVVCSCRCGG